MFSFCINQKYEFSRKKNNNKILEKKKEKLKD